MDLKNQIQKREIKFRAWDGERMIYLSDLSIGLKKGKRISPYAYFSKDTFGSYVKLGNHEIMQFTGLLDCKGKEIYEGDILTYPNPSCKGVVMFGVYSFGSDDTYQQGNGFYLQSNQESACGYFSVSHIEVIGNQFENPELL